MPRRQLLALLMVLPASAYLMAAIYALPGWLGVQVLPAGWNRPALPVWALMSLTAPLGTLAVLYPTSVNATASPLAQLASSLGPGGWLMAPLPWFLLVVVGMVAILYRPARGWGSST